MNGSRIKQWVKLGKEYIAVDSHNVACGVLRGLDDTIQPKATNDLLRASERLMKGGD